MKLYQKFLLALVVGIQFALLLLIAEAMRGTTPPVWARLVIFTGVAGCVIFGLPDKQEAK